MKLTHHDKEKFKTELVACLQSEPEIKKIIIFGSFLYSDAPEDMDVALVLSSDEHYYTLVPRLRSKIRSLLNRIPVDIVPVLDGIKSSVFLEEIQAGEVVYER